MEINYWMVFSWRHLPELQDRLEFWSFGSINDSHGKSTSRGYFGHVDFYTVGGHPEGRDCGEDYNPVIGF